MLDLRVEPFGSIDITIDGADRTAPDGRLVKGGGAAHTRKKIVAAAADRCVVIADSSKRLTALHPPVPLELPESGPAATMRRLHPASLRDTAQPGSVIHPGQRSPGTKKAAPVAAHRHRIRPAQRTRPRGFSATGGSSGAASRPPS
ncbi:ribose-5-phosphate isomerase A [Streptomyces sp. NBC_00316]|uniref:ribose-5-phosphate isomerase A n=1 Tax=Streptomyces sp. NBC_00316 TaxID=2975710 RepID=UPI002E2A7B95|nr:ribose-5-phosphate isomerase A [Streptomyces sp. NBC_00316]